VLDTGASRCRPGESREPSQRQDPGFHQEPWIPAFAGMTILVEAAKPSRGMDDVMIQVHSRKIEKKI